MYVVAWRELPHRYIGRSDSWAETEAGVSDHFQQSMESWEDFPALLKWLEKYEVTGLPAARIVNSLW